MVGGSGTLRMTVHLGFDGLTNKLMKIVKEPLARQVLFWLTIVLIYQVLEQRSRTRRLRSRLFEGRARRFG